MIARIRILAISMGILAIVSLAALIACTPAQSAMWAQIEQTVLTDLENGSALSAIEAAVVAIDPAAASVAGLVDTIIQDAIAFLVDSGALPTPASKVRARGLQTELVGKIGAHK